MKRYIRSSIGNYRGYNIEIEKSGDQRYYFVDDHRKIHYADLEDELKSKIDKFIEEKSVVESSTYVQKLIRKRPQKDRSGNPLVYSGSGGRSLVGINYDSIDKFDTKEDALEDLKKTAKKFSEWKVVKFEDEQETSIESGETISGWYVGNPDPTGRLEGDLRFENKMKSWRDVYKEFVKIADKYFPDDDKIDQEINKLYFKHSKNPYFQEAWKRWGDSAADDPEELEDIDSSVNVDSLLKGDAVVVQTSNSELHPVIFEKYKENDTFLGWDWTEYLRRFFLIDIVYHAENFQDAVDYIDRKDGVTAAVKTKVKPFVVTYMYDDGDVENGPNPYGGEDLVYAEDEDEACRQWEEYCDADRLDGYAGCNARPATPEDVNRLEAEKKDYGIMDPVSAAVDVEYYDLPNSLYMFLQDVVQETGAFEYGDLRNVVNGVTRDQKRQLSNFKRRYYRAAENQDEKKCNKIGGEIADWLFTLK